MCHLKQGVETMKTAETVETVEVKECELEVLAKGLEITDKINVCCGNASART
jgi:hypothetical protein